MSNWTRINAMALVDRIDRSTTTDDLRSISPYDIPEAFRGEIRDGATLVLEFRYATEEEHQQSHNSGIVTLWTGKNSGRLYRLEADIRSIPAANAIEIMISDAGVAISTIPRKGRYRNRDGNYQLAQNVMGSNLFSNVIGESLSVAN